MTEDVQRAMKEIKEYDGQKITLCVSKKKMHEKKKPGVYVWSHILDSLYYTSNGTVSVSA